MLWPKWPELFLSCIIPVHTPSFRQRWKLFCAFQIGSLSWSVLPGKVMFRNLAYITSDYTVRVQDGYLIFRWWRTYVPKDEDQDLSHSDTRVSLQLYGFEFHVYNRSKVYRDLEKKLFGESHMFGDESASMLTNGPFSFFFHFFTLKFIFILLSFSFRLMKIAPGWTWKNKAKRSAK